MKRWGIPLVIAVTVALGGGYGYYVLHRSDDRFGDPAVLEQIKASTDCLVLRQRVDDATQTMASTRGGADFDRAVGYSNAANDRMRQLGC